MNPPPPLPPPPPFGDPANINSENAAALRKGVSIGCIIGTIVGVGLIAMVLGIVFFVFSFIRNQETCVATLKAAQASEVMKRELGEPMAMGWFVSGSSQTVNGEGTADWTVPIAGPAGEASVHTVGTRTNGKWVYSQMEATIQKTGQQVDLLQR